jgi:twitching motility two-component system response regulator PilG
LASVLLLIVPRIRAIFALPLLFFTNHIKTKSFFFKVMRLEFESDTATLPFNEIEEFESINADGSNRAQELLRLGIKAAQSGNRAKARQLLLRVTETEPQNENAWLWMASISEYPEELLIFLSNVLDINPNNERALEWTKATRSLLATTFVERGIVAANAERSDFAKQCFYQAVAHDAKNELAWLWLAFVSGSAEEKRTHLDKVLAINPENETARAALKEIHTETAQTLLRQAIAVYAADRPAANELLAEALRKSPELTNAWLFKSHLTDNFEEKIRCFEKILAINPSHEAAKAGLDSLRPFMKNGEPQPASENFQSQSEDKVVAEEDKFAGESRLEENPSAEQSEEANPAQEFGFNQTFVEDSPFVEETEQETELRETEETQYSEEASSGKEMSFTEEEQFEEEQYFSPAGNEEPEAGFKTESETSENQNEETRAVEDDAQDKESFAAENSFSGQSFQTKNSYSDGFENEDEESMQDDSPVLEEADEQVFAGSEATASDDSQSEADNSANNFYQEDDMLEVENYTAENYRSTEYSANEESAFEESDLMQLEADAAKTEENLEFSTETNQKVSHKPQTESYSCPFCNTENDAQAFACGMCRAVLSLSNLEMLLANQSADAELLGCAVEQMEAEKDLRGFSENELLQLGVGHINLKNLRRGFAYLQQASQASPNDVLLSSQVNRLAIRLEEIERQEENHDSMPKNRKILVVDDSATVRKLISGKLEKSGHEVVCAVDGMDALAKLNEIAPDLILLDITMPRMDGYQVCKLIRNNPLTKDIPIVMISGKDGFFDKVRGRMAGTTGYITKPFGPETLMKALDVYIKTGGELVFSEEEEEVLVEV